MYKILLEHLFSLGYLTRSGTAGSCVNSMFNVLRNLQTFTFLLAMHETSNVLQFLCILTNIRLFSFFKKNYDSHSCGCLSHCGFYFYSLKKNDEIGHLFLCLLAIYTSFLKKCSFKCFFHLRGIVCLFVTGL